MSYWIATGIICRCFLLATIVGYFTIKLSGGKLTWPGFSRSIWRFGVVFVLLEIYRKLIEGGAS